MDFRLADGFEELADGEILAALQTALPASIRPFRVADPVRKAKELAAARFRVELLAAPEAASQIKEFLRREAIPVEKHSKKGTATVIDLAGVLRDVLCSGTEWGLNLEMTLPGGPQGAVNPSLLLEAMQKEGIAFEIVGICRTALLDLAGELFA